VIATPEAIETTCYFVNTL